MCRAFWNDRGMVSFDGSEARTLDKPERGAYVAGGLLFGPGQMLKEVPFDPNLDYL